MSASLPENMCASLVSEQPLVISAMYMQCGGAFFVLHLCLAGGGNSASVSKWMHLI